MLYSDEFLQTLRDDPIVGVKEACRIVISQMKGSGPWIKEQIEACEEADLLMIELSAAGLLPIPYSSPQLDLQRDKRTEEILQGLFSIVAACAQHEAQAARERLASRLRIGIGVKFAYEFSQGDLVRVQTLLNDLRALVSEAKGFEVEHRQRILVRLEALQRELHKRVSDLDRFWGLIGDAGVILAKLGNDAKPIVDRVREIVDIVWNTQGRAEELPSTAKPPRIGYEPPQSE